MNYIYDTLFSVIGQPVPLTYVFSYYLDNVENEGA